MDVYSMVTERIINQLEKGEIPWKKPWAKCLDGTFNRITRKPYSLLNKLLLLHGGEYATFKQWEQIGGRVKNGEKSEIVVFWKLQDLVEKDENGNIEMKQIPLLRYYNVFHISQVNNVMPLIRTEDFGTKPIERAETILHEYLNREHITLSAEESDRAFYSLQTDSITVPKITPVIPIFFTRNTDTTILMIDMINGRYCPCTNRPLDVLKWLTVLIIPVR